MPQIHCSVPAELESELRARAKARRLPLSKYVAEILEREVGGGWPEGWFERIPGSWKGALKRAPQGAFEKRQSL